MNPILAWMQQLLDVNSREKHTAAQRPQSAKLLLELLEDRVTPDVSYWTAPMLEVHENFTGLEGTITRFGDSITESSAFFKELQVDHANLTPEASEALDWLQTYQLPASWDWQTSETGAESGTTSSWPLEIDPANGQRRIDNWLADLNPEMAVVLWGTNDIGFGVDVATYETNLREIVTTIKDNGTIPILTTIPPRSGADTIVSQYVDAIRDLALDEQVPLIDYYQEIVTRNPNGTWDGSLVYTGGDVYEVETLIAGDGIHPSNPTAFQRDFGDEALDKNGYVLRNYLTLLSTYDVYTDVLNVTEDVFGPSGNLTNPTSGSSALLGDLNNQGFLAITYADVGSNGLDLSTIDGDEITLSGSGLGSVTLTGAAIAQGSNVYHYTFTGQFVEGDVQVDFQAGTFADTAGNTNLAEAESFSAVPAQEILYRVNAGGPQVSDWVADTGSFHNLSASQSQTAATGVLIDLTHSSVPADTPMEIFQTERWDPTDGSEMQWDFAVDPGAYEVRLYFAETYDGAFSVGARIFNVSIEGEQVLTNYDVFDKVGAYTAIVETFQVNSDGTLNINFGHVIENPAIKAIEILRIGEAPPPEPPTPAELINVSDTDLNFVVAPEETLAKTITLTHTGNASDPDVVIESTTITGASVFTDSFSDTPVTLTAGQSITIDVTYSPTQQGTDNATLGIQIQGETDPVTVSLTGTSIPTAAGGVVYRVNAGGPLVSDTTDWEADVPSIYSNEGLAQSLIATVGDAINLSDPSIPVGTPVSIFQSERWDPSDGQEMQYDFAVTPGDYLVRLYFADTFTGTNAVGARVFDVSLEGQLVLDNYDIFAKVGGFTGVVETFQVTSDSNLDIDFVRVVENPAIKAIEIFSLTAQTNRLGTTDTALSFENVLEGETETQTIALTNQGSAGDPDITINATDISGTDAALFSSSFTSAVTLAPGESTTLTVTYSPTLAGAHGATLNVTHSGDNSPLSITLDGTSISAPTGTPGDVIYRVNTGGPLVSDTTNWESDDPSVYSNEATAQSFTFSVSNPINLDDASVPVGTPASIFQTERWDSTDGVEMQYDFAVTPGDYQVRLYFAETFDGTAAVGARVFDVLIEGQTVLANYDVFAKVGAFKGVVETFQVTSDGTLDIDFSHGIENPAIKAIEILSVPTSDTLGSSAESLDFGTAVIGEPVTQTVTLTNLGSTGDSDITISSASFTGTNPAEFTSSFAGAPIVIAPGASTTIDVNYDPTAEGSHTAILSLTHSGTNTPFNVTLAGSAIAPQSNLLGITGSPIDFGAIVIDNTVSQDITLTNLGGASDPDIVISTTDITGADPALFSDNFVDGSPITLAPGASATITITYAPNITGDHTATFAMTHSGDNSPINVPLAGTSVQTLTIGFGKSILQGANPSAPTSLQFGPDGRLYVARQDGLIEVYTIERNGPNDYSVTASEVIDLVNKIPNHDDDGTLNPDVDNRLVTGLVVAGTAQNPIIFVGSSDPRIGGGPSSNDLNLDTNSGIISRLTFNGTNWEKLDLVRGLPRSEENHATNGLQYDPLTNTLYAAQGGHTNMGAPSNNFVFLPEYALSAAILSIDLDAIGESTYDIPTLDDEDQPGPDANDPFGGNDGKNQAMLVPGGPVQVYAPGFRNPFDVVLTESGRLYSIDNGPNAGWGSVPLDSNGNPTTAQTAGDATNATSEPGLNYGDGLHYITGPGYYAGHPNPTRANLDNTFNDSNPQAAVSVANEIEGHYLTPGVDNDALVVFGTSTNGLTEYTASNFGGQLQGDLIAASFFNEIVRVKVDAEGDDVVLEETLFGSVGALPLDVTAIGDAGPFPGTIWAGDLLAGNIVIFEPNDYEESGEICTGHEDPDLDEDGDGYSNGDEILNGTNPCSAADVPPDADGDFISNLLDDDDDNDTQFDVDDPFAIDAQNGRATPVPLLYTWENEGIGLGGLLNLGFTGLMTNGIDNYEDLYDFSKLTAGGAAGVLTIDEASQGTALGSANTQEQAFQFGIDVTPTTPTFTVHSRVIAPFAGITPEAGQQLGLFLGTGDQDNYVEVVVEGAGGVQVISEIDGTPTIGAFEAVALPGPDYVDLYLTYDPAASTVQAKYSVTVGGSSGSIITLDDPISVPAEWLSGTNGLAIGVISTSAGASSTFSATWDFMEVYLETANVLTGDPDALTYGNVLTGTSEVQSITLTNSGNVGDPAIVLGSGSITGTGAAFFVANDVSGITLQPGESTTLDVAYSPTTVGSHNAILSISHSGSNSPIDVALSGTGIESSNAEALLVVLPQGGIESSTYGDDSFQITNNSTAGVQIESVSFDLSTSILPDVVFDPVGTAGDLTAKDFTPDSSSDVGEVTHSFAGPHDDGFDQLTINFTDFGPGEFFNFSVDVDPTSIRGSSAPGPNESGSVSGLELVGSQVTITFSDGTTEVVSLYRIPGSVSGSQNVVKVGSLAQPVIELLSVTTPATVTDANQIVRIEGPAGATVQLLIAEGGLYTDGLPGGGFDIDAFEANTLVDVNEQSVLIGAGGVVDVPITLTQSDSESGINHIVAVIRDVDGRTGPTSNVLVVELDPQPTPQSTQLSADPPTDPPSDPPAASLGNPTFSVSNLTLINAETDQPIASFDPLNDGATLNLATLPTIQLSIRADVVGTVGSVQFILDGGLFRTENVVPYALAGDSSGDYSAWTPSVGTHTLTVIPYAGSGGTGEAGGASTITFNVIDDASVAQADSTGEKETVDETETDPVVEVFAGSEEETPNEEAADVLFASLGQE